MKKILLAFWPVIFIFFIWGIFASPYFLKNEVPFPSTYLVTNFGPWNNYVGYLGPVKNSATPDVISQIFPWKNLVIESWKSGQVPLWNTYVFSGTPLLANYQSAALTPSNLIYFILPFIDAWSLQVLFQPLLAGLFMYFFVRSLKLSHSASLISSLAFMFCGFITTWGLYGALGYAILFLPLSLFALEKFYQEKKWYYLVLLALTIPLSFFAGHFQTSLYFLLIVGAYSIFKLIQVKDIKTFSYSIFSIIFGLLLCAPQLLPSIEFYQESVRSAIFQKIEAIQWTYLPSFIAPDFFGNPVTANNWFGHYAEWNSYIGIIPFILGFYSLRKRSIYVLFFGIVALVSLLLAFDTPLLNLLIALKIPVLSTSAASRIIVLFSLSMSVLAGFGFDKLMADLENKKNTPIVSLIAIFAVVFGVIWFCLITKVFIDPEKVSISLSNFRLPTIIFAVFAASVLANKFVKNKKILIGVGALIILLTAFDLLRFTTKWYPFESRDYVYPKISISNQLNSMAGYNREFGNFDQQASEMYKIPNLEGYDPLYIQRYGEFLAAGKDGKYHTPERSVVTLSKNGDYTGKILNFLGVKYIIHKLADGQNVWAFPFWEYPADQFKEIFKDNVYQVFNNDKVLPRAFIVGDVKVVVDKQDAIKELFKDSLDFSKTVVLEENPGDNIINGATGSASIVSYSPNEIKIDVLSSGSGILILSDPYYPGWKAYVDEKQTKIYRSNYAFRGIVIPDGKHAVVFRYEPDSFRNGLIIAFGGVIGIVILSLYLKFGKK